MSSQAGLCGHNVGALGGADSVGLHTRGLYRIEQMNIAV